MKIDDLMVRKSDLLQSGLQDFEGKRFIVKTCSKLESIYGHVCSLMLKDNRDKHFDLIIVDFHDALTEMAEVIEKVIKETE